MRFTADVSGPGTWLKRRKSVQNSTAGGAVRLGWLLLFLTAFIGFGTGSVQAAVIHVDSGATGGANGTSWADAYTTITSALNAVASGDQIWVKAGTYGENLYILGYDHSGVSLYGGFSGSETSLEERDHQTNITTLNPAGAFTSPVVTMDRTSNFLLDGFVISNGNMPTGKGAGMDLWDVDDTNQISNCVFSGNSAENGGGAYLVGSSPVFTSCVFRDNTTTEYGGGLYLDMSDATLNSCVFSGNTATEHGGGLYLNTSDATLNSCVFSGNTATNYGGGLYIASSEPTLNSCVIRGNSSPDGGGLYIHGEPATLTDCTISGNSASNNGGGLHLDNVHGMSITNCLISGNSADGNGGGFCMQNSSDSTLANCIISGNSAQFNGGGFWLSSSPSTLTNCTLSDNSATASGGAIFMTNSSSLLTNCIFQRHTHYALYKDSGSSPTTAFCLFYGNDHHAYEMDLSTGNNIIDEVPGFVMSGTGQVTGTWTDVSYDGTTGITTLTNDQTDFTAIHNLVEGRLINPDTSQNI